MTTATRLTKINSYLAELGRLYHRAIPLNDIFGTLSAHGYEPVQEDGTPWSGLLLGRASGTVIELRDVVSGRHTKWLSLSWYKMDVTGNFEITGYVS